MARTSKWQGGTVSKTYRLPPAAAENLEKIAEKHRISTGEALARLLLIDGVIVASLIDLLKNQSDEKIDE